MRIAVDRFIIYLLAPGANKGPTDEWCWVARGCVLCMHSLPHTPSAASEHTQDIHSYKRTRGVCWHKRRAGGSPALAATLSFLPSTSPVDACLREWLAPILSSLLALGPQQQITRERERRSAAFIGTLGARRDAIYMYALFKH